MREMLRPKSPGKLKIKSGDCLWKISEREYNDPKKWRDIARENHLRSPYRIFTGQWLKLPNVYIDKPDVPSSSPTVRAQPAAYAAPSNYQAQKSVTVDPDALHLASPVMFPPLEFEVYEFKLPIVIALDPLSAATLKVLPGVYKGEAKLALKMKLQKKGVMENVAVSKEAIKFTHGPAAHDALLGIAANLSLDLKDLMRGKLKVVPSLSLKSSTSMGGWEFELKSLGPTILHGSFSQTGQKFSYDKHESEGTVECEVKLERKNEELKTEPVLVNVWKNVMAFYNMKQDMPKPPIAWPVVIILTIPIIMLSFAMRFQMASLSLGGAMPGEPIQCSPKSGYCPPQEL